MENNDDKKLKAARQAAVSKAIVLLMHARPNFKLPDGALAVWNKALELFDPESILAAAEEVAFDYSIEWPGVQHIRGRCVKAIHEQMSQARGLMDPAEAWSEAQGIRLQYGGHQFTPDNKPWRRVAAENHGPEFLAAFLGAGMLDEDVQVSSLTDRGFRFREVYKAEIAKTDREFDVLMGAHRLPASDTMPESLTMRDEPKQINGGSFDGIDTSAIGRIE